MTLQEQARALGDPTRHAIFRHISMATAPLGIAELNREFPLNHNAIRQHLAKLVAAGLVIEATETAVRRGRPRLVYRINPAAGQWGTTGPYERLSRMLVEVIRSGLEPEKVGRAAAGQFQVPTPSGDITADIGAAMARQGFEPEIKSLPGGAAEIVLRRCPFATVALADRNTVCALHLGIAEGLAADSAMRVTELVAYDPRKADCKIRLRLDAEANSQAMLTLRGPAGRR